MGFEKMKKCRECDEYRHFSDVCPHCGSQATMIVVVKWVEDGNPWKPWTWYEGHYEERP